MESLLMFVIGIAILGGIVYVLIRPHGGESHGGRDIYFYVVAFITLCLIYWAVADLFRVKLEEWWETGSRYTTVDSDLRRLSLRLSTLVVALPVWAFHWFKAVMKPVEEQDKASRRLYTVSVLVLLSLILLGTGTGLVYQGFNSLLGISGTDAREALTFMLPYGVVTAGVWGWHMKMYLGMKEKKMEEVIS